MLAPVLAILLLAALVGHGSPAISQVIRREIIAALKGPLDLLDERSPGERGPRVLLSIKGPNERVLSTTRERKPFPVIPAPDPPVFALASTVASDAVASVPIVPPEYEPLPGDQAGGPPPFLPFFPGMPPGSPGTIGEGAPPPNAPSPPPASSEPPNPITIILPEPAPWTMMILGLSAIGVAARRRARQQTCVR